MSRDFTPSDFIDPREHVSVAHERTPDTERTHRDQRRNVSQTSQVERNAETSRVPNPVDVRFQEPRGTFYVRDHAYRLRASELHTIAELGTFRVIATNDLAKHAYQDQRKESQEDISNLVRQGLIRRGTFEGAEANPRELLTLSKAGHRFLRANRLLPEGQSAYHGFVKPKEANHDADIYRLYQKEAGRIIDKGGKNLRVSLDFELKKKINCDFAKFGPESRQEIADRHGLHVVRGKIPVPDLRIEYETPEGEMGRVDLELLTEHYRPSQVSEKVRAGFTLYASRGDADRLRRVLDQRELTAEILSL